MEDSVEKELVFIPKDEMNKDSHSSITKSNTLEGKESENSIGENEVINDAVNISLHELKQETGEELKKENLETDMLISNMPNEGQIENCTNNNLPIKQFENNCKAVADFSNDQQKILEYEIEKEDEVPESVLAEEYIIHDKEIVGNSSSENETYSSNIQENIEKNVVKEQLPIKSTEDIVDEVQSNTTLVEEKQEIKKEKVFSEETNPILLVQEEPPIEKGILFNAELKPASLSDGQQDYVVMKEVELKGDSSTQHSMKKETFNKPEIVSDIHITNNRTEFIQDFEKNMQIENQLQQIKSEVPNMTYVRSKINNTRSTAVPDSMESVRREATDIENATQNPSLSKIKNLKKIFTPSNEGQELTPINRKLYASSAFYSPFLHPTMEDQLELARRISNSLSDISNQKSKGQSMYVNRKNRSVKWVHESDEKEPTAQQTASIEHLKYEIKETENNTYINRITSSISEKSTENWEKSSTVTKVPLKLIMNPQGQLRDFNSVQDSINIKTGLLSPDKCAELMADLNAQKGKGAELFAKRRKKAEDWVVNFNQNGIQNSSEFLDLQNRSPNLDRANTFNENTLPGSEDLKSRQKNALHTKWSKIPYDYTAPSSDHEYLKSSPSSVPAISCYEQRANSGVFAELSGIQSHTPNRSDGKPSFTGNATYTIQPTTVLRREKIKDFRELAYKPSIPQGWKQPSVSLPKELYVPKEIPHESYGPPPSVPSKMLEKGGCNFVPALSSYDKISINQNPDWNSIGADHNNQNYRNQSNENVFASSRETFRPYIGCGKLLKENAFSNAIGKTEQSISPEQTCFRPSPLPYEKLAKFETFDSQNSKPYCSYNQIKNSVVVNRSPLPYSGMDFNIPRFCGSFSRDAYSTLRNNLPFTDF